MYLGGNHHNYNSSRTGQQGSVIMLCKNYFEFKFSKIFEVFSLMHGFRFGGDWSAVPRRKSAIGGIDQAEPSATLFLT